MPGRRVVYHRSVYGFGGPRTHRTSGFTGFTAAIVIIMLAALVLIAMSMPKGDPAPSTYAREKLDGRYGYQSGSVRDDLGWLDSPDRMNRDLRKFYDKTGVQPYLYLAAGHGDLNNSAEAQHMFAEAYYEANCPNEACVLLVYFDTGVPSIDGECTLVYGREAGAIFDDEAMDIFWGYLDSYWSSDLSEQDVFTKAFLDTADRIMSRTSTGLDVIKWIVVFLTVWAVIGGVLLVMRTRRAHQRQRREEAAAILNADIHVDPSGGDGILDKWSSPGSGDED